VGTDEDEGFVGAFFNRLPRLVSDAMETGSDMAEGGDEGPIGRAYPDMAAVSRNAGKDPDMASSQIPPMERSRAPGFVAAL